MLKKILTEPLLHFIVISILFFVGYDLLNPVAPDEQIITVSEGRVAQINNSFLSRWNREALPSELDNAIQGFAIGEMYQREARALSLDVGDKVIAQRLRKKMTYLLEDLASGNEATDEALNKFYQDNSAKYRSSAQYGFKQVFISPDRTETELNKLLLLQDKRIAQGLAPEGDGSLLPSEVDALSKEQLARKFGELFPTELASLEIGQWQGPIKSNFGLHFIFLQEKTPETIKPFEMVRKSVLHDWQYQNNKTYTEQYEQRLLERYTINIQMPSLAKEG